MIGRGASIGRIWTLLLEGYWEGRRLEDLEGLDPDVVDGRVWEGTSLLDGDWKGRQLEGSGRRYWMGIGRDVVAGRRLEGTLLLEGLDIDGDWKGR